MMSSAKNLPINSSFATTSDFSPSLKSFLAIAGFIFVPCLTATFPLLALTRFF